MAASDPAGGQKFWFNGVPINGLAKSGVVTGGVKFWFNGIPYNTIFPASQAQQFAAFSIPQHSLSQVVRRMVGY